MGFLSVEMGHLSLPAETCLFGLLSQCFTKIKDIFHLDDPSAILAEPSTLERILNSVFDTTTLPFVTEKSIRIAAGLDDHDRSCLFVQAVAGLVLVFRHLDSAGSVLSATMLSRELQLFAESEQRRGALDRIGSSSLFTSCYTKSSIVDFVMAALDEQDVEHHDGLTLGTAGKDLSGDNAAWLSDRPCKKMGLPWGFTIMALN
jgi:hypothetical protein